MVEKGAGLRRHHRLLRRRALDPRQRPRRRQASRRESRERARELPAAETGNFFQDDIDRGLPRHRPQDARLVRERDRGRASSRRSIPTITRRAGRRRRRPVGARGALQRRRARAGAGRLRPPLATITFIGMMFNSSNTDLKHFFRATKSLSSALYVAKRLAVHLQELARVPARRAGDERQRAGGAAGAELPSTSASRSTPTRRPESSDRATATGAPAPMVRGCGRSVRISARRGRGARLWRLLRTTSADRPRPIRTCARAASIFSPVPRTTPATASALAEDAGRRNGDPLPVAGGLDAGLEGADRRRELRCVPAPARPLQAWNHRASLGTAALLQRVRSLPRRRCGDDRGLRRRAPRPRPG